MNQSQPNTAPENSPRKEVNSRDILNLYDENYFNDFGQDGPAENLSKFAMFTEKYKALESAGLKPTDTVLDLGCGRGDMVFHLAHCCSAVYGLDYAQPALDIAEKLLAAAPESARQRVRLLLGDVSDIPAPMGLFDNVFFLDVIEHLSYSEQEKALKEIHRVLKPGGKVVILTPLAGMPHWLVSNYWRFFKPEKYKHAKANAYTDEREPHHIGLLGIDRAKKLLADCGFKSRVNVITSYWQDVRSDMPPFRKWLRYKALVRLFGTKILAVAEKR